MRKIAIFNQKGGVGKTTTTVNLGAGLSRNGRKVIIIDVDPQGDISSCHKVQAKKNLYHVLKGEASLKEATSSLGKNLDIIHADGQLADVEQELTENKQITDALERVFTPHLNYDYVLLDCAPSIRPLNISALTYAKEVIIPSSTDILGFGSLKKTTNTIIDFNQKYDQNLFVSSIVPTLFEGRRRVCSSILKKMGETYTSLLVTEPIRRNSKLNEAPRVKKSIFKYAKSSPGAEDYWKLVKTVLENENMYDTRFSASQRQKAVYEYYTEGKKRELMIVDNKLTFGYKFFTKQVDIDNDHILHKIAPIGSTLSGAKATHTDVEIGPA